MGFTEIREKLANALKNKSDQYKEAQEKSEARDDYETTDKALRNKRRDVRKYMDQDEKEQLEAYLRARRAQEDRSWMNPYGMLDTQEINISKPSVNVFANNRNIHKIDSRRETRSVLETPNAFGPKRWTELRGMKKRKKK
jgi:hypothetical protein